MCHPNQVRSLAIIILVIALAACSPSTPLAEPTEVSNPPAATLEIDGKTQTVDYCGYSLEKAENNVCNDAVNILANGDPLLAAGETSFMASFHFPVDTLPDSLSVLVMPVTDETPDGLTWDMSVGQMHLLPVKRDVDVLLRGFTGLNIVILNAGWENVGDFGYWFLVRVGDEFPDTIQTLDPPASLPATKPPAATLEINGKTQTAGIGSYCWQNTGSLMNNVCVDMQGILTANEPLVAEETPFTAIFHLPFDAPPDSLMISVMPAITETIGGLNGLRFWAKEAAGWSGSLPLKQDADILLQEKEGTYIIQLNASWNGLGKVSYGFLAQVGNKPVESTKIPVESTLVPAFTVRESITPLVRIGKGKDGDADEPNSFEVSKDGRWVAISTMKGVYLYETVTQEKIWFQPLAPLHNGLSRHLSFNPDGTQLSIGQAGNILLILSVENGETLMTLKGKERIRGVWSPDGKSILTGAGCEQVLIWDAATGKLRHTVQPTKCNPVTEGIIYADWSGDGRIIYGYKGNGYVLAWDAVTLLPLDGFQPQPSEYFSGFYPAPTKSMFALGGISSLTIIDGETGDIIKSLHGEPKIDVHLGSFAWSPDGKRIASTFIYSRLVWDVETGELLVSDKKEQSYAGLAWMPDNQTLIGAVSDNDSLLGFDFETGQTVFALGGWELKPNSALGWDGNNLLTFDGSVEIRWSSTTGEILSRREIPPPAWLSTASAFRSPDGRFVASPNAISDNSGNEILQLHGDDLYDKVAWSPDGTRLVSGDSISGRVVVWDAQSGDVLLRLALEEYEAYHPFWEALAWSPDGKWIVAGGSVTPPSHSGFVILWNAQTGQQSKILGGMLGWESIKSLVWSPDGRWLAAGASGQICLWDLQAESVPLAILNYSSNARKAEIVQDIALSFSPDGHLLASTTPDGAILIWKIP